MHEPEAVADESGLGPPRARNDAAVDEERTYVPPRTSAPGVLRFIMPIALVLLVFLAFMPALTAGKVFWDDDRLLDWTAQYKTLNAENVRWMFTTSYSGHFQPLTWLSYAMDFALSQGSLGGYHLPEAVVFHHLTNVVLHAFAVVVFYFVARLLLALGAGDVRAARSWPFVLSAGFAAVLFANHPLRAESVVWLAERRDVLSGFLYLLAVAFYLRYAATLSPLRTGSELDREAPRGWPWYVGAVVACILSLSAKASAMTLPVVLLILDVYPLRRLGGARGWFRGAALRVWGEKLPFFVLTVAGGVRAVIAQAEGGDIYSLAEHDIPARLAQACYGLVFYLWKTVLPVGLGPLYQIPPREVLFGSMLWGSIIVVVALVFAGVRLRRTVPGFATALVVYVVILSPVLGFLQSGPQLVADRYSYLSCLGLAVLAGAALLCWLRPGSWWADGPRRPLLGLLVAAVIAVLFHATTLQADIWRSPISLWGQALRVSSDNSFAHVSYADALARAQDFENAVRHYREGLALDPDDAIAHQHLAQVYRIGGYNDEAIEGFTRAIELDPHRPWAHRALAELLIAKGEAVEALKVLRARAADNPRDLPAIDLMAQLLAAHSDERVRNGEEAVKWALFASAANEGKNAAVLMTLATAYAEAGRFEKAIETASRALEIARRDRDQRLSTELELRIELFRQSKPFRLEPPR